MSRGAKALAAADAQAPPHRRAAPRPRRPRSREKPASLFWVPVDDAETGTSYYINTLTDASQVGRAGQGSGGGAGAPRDGAADCLRTGHRRPDARAAHHQWHAAPRLAGRVGQHPLTLGPAPSAPPSPPRPLGHTRTQWEVPAMYAWAKRSVDDPSVQPQKAEL